jgi:hypothetical protein
MFFILLILLLAIFWATIGIMLAKWLKQAGYTKPFKGRDKDVYGAGTGYGREVGFNGGMGRDFTGVGVGSGRVIELGGYGEGRIKGL